jgi:hypothetical protein
MGVFLIYIAVNLFLLDGTPLCKPLYDKVYPIAKNIELLVQFFNTTLPILISAGLLIYLFRGKKK